MHRPLAFVVVATLAACGGGGGAGGVTLHLDAGARIEDQYMQGDEITTYTLFGTITGNARAFVDPVITVEGLPEELFTEVEVYRAYDNRFAVEPVERLEATTPGHFVGTMRIHVSLDPEGGQEVGGSPLEVPYDVFVYEGIGLDAGSQTVDMTFGGPAESRTFHLTCPPVETSWHVLTAGSECSMVGDVVTTLRWGEPELECSSDGTVTLSLSPGAVGTGTEEIYFETFPELGGGSRSFSSRVTITKQVAPDAAPLAAFVPEGGLQLVAPRSAVGHSASFGVFPNSDVTMARGSFEYLSHPPAADEIAHASAWFNGDVVWVNNLPVGTYTGRIPYTFTRAGVDTTVYYPVTLEVIAD